MPSQLLIDQPRQRRLSFPHDRRDVDARDVRRLPTKAPIVSAATRPFLNPPFLRNDFADRALPDALKLAPCPTSSARLLGVSTNTSGPDLGRQALRPGFLFGFPPICLGGHNPPAGRIRRVIRQSGQRLSRGCQVTSSERRLLGLRRSLSQFCRAPARNSPRAAATDGLRPIEALPALLGRNAKARLVEKGYPASKPVPASVHVTSVLHRLAKSHANSAKIVETPCNTKVTCPKGASVKIR